MLANRAGPLTVRQQLDEFVEALAERRRTSRTAEGTVRNHVSNIPAELGVKSRTQAVLNAKELGHRGARK